MMKEQTSAVIVEIRGRYAAALTEDGAFVRVRNAKYALGQQVLLGEHTREAEPVRRRARLTAYAGMVAGLLLLLLGGFKGYTTPVGVVSLDVNPSIEYTINCFDRVLDIAAVNEDGGQLLADMDERSLLYHSVDEAMDETILALRESGYFAESTENDVVISVSSYSERHTTQMAARLGERVGQQDDLMVYSVPVSRGEVQSAHDLGTSAGKLHIIERLGESWNQDESFDPIDWIGQPVREIIAQTKGQHSGEKTEDDHPQQSAQQQPDANTIENTPGGGSAAQSDEPVETTPRQGQGGEPGKSGGAQGGGAQGGGGGPP